MLPLHNLIWLVADICHAPLATPPITEFRCYPTTPTTTAHVWERMVRGKGIELYHTCTLEIHVIRLNPLLWTPCTVIVEVSLNSGVVLQVVTRKCSNLNLNSSTVCTLYNTYMYTCTNVYAWSTVIYTCILLLSVDHLLIMSYWQLYTIGVEGSVWRDQFIGHYIVWSGICNFVADVICTHPSWMCLDVYMYCTIVWMDLHVHVQYYTVHILSHVISYMWISQHTVYVCCTSTVYE